MRPIVAVTATAVPALALAVLGTTHPAVLTPESAPWWRDLHVVGLVLFPLLALGPWAVTHVSRPAGVAGWVLSALAAVLGLVYAAFYGALDALAGIGGGHETMQLGPGPWVAALFGIADELGAVGSYAYLSATVLATVLALVRAPGAWRLLGALGAVFAVAGAWSFLTSHIYYPFGVATMVMLAIGHTLLAVAATRRSRRTDRRPHEPRRDMASPLA